MSFLTLNHKFLLDENVKVSLSRLLESHDFDVKLAPKATSDSKLALISKKEARILVTNDEDFRWYNETQVFSIILLKIPQTDNQVLLESFTKLLSEFNKFIGRFVVLETDRWRDSPLLKKGLR